MNKTFPTLALLLLLLVPIATPASAEGDKKGDKKEAPTLFVVVQVGDDLQLVESKGLNAFKKKLATDHKAAVKAHAAAKKAARKAKEAFTDKKPKAPKLKVVVNRPLPQEKAQEAMDKIIEERRRAAAKKSKK